MAEIQDILAFGQSLRDLPVELLMKIFGYLPSPHIKVLGSMCKKMAHIARPRLFHTIIVGRSKRQLRVLAHVAKHPVLRHYVKNLSYDLSRYAVMTFDEYVKRLPPRQDGGTYTRQDQLVGYHHTRNLIKDQWDIIKKTLDAQSYPKTLSHFPNLHQLTFEYHSTGPYRYRAAPSTIPLRTTDSFVQDSYGDQVRPFESLTVRRLTRACLRAKVPIDTLCIVSNPDTYDFHQDVIFGQLAKYERNNGYAFFKRLTTIDVTAGNTLATFGHVTLPSCPTERFNFADLLQSVVGLRRLRFGYTEAPLYYVDGKVRGGVYYMPIAVQFGDNFCWKPLRSLELHDMLLLQSELVRFLSLHADSLCEVSLADISIFYSAWASVVDCIASLPRLTGVKIIRPKEVEEKYSVRPSKKLAVKYMSNRNIHEIPGLGEIWERKIMGSRLNTLRSELCTPDIRALKVSDT